MEQELLDLSLKERLMMTPTGEWVGKHWMKLLAAGSLILISLVWSVNRDFSVTQSALTQFEDAFTAWKANPQNEQLYQTFKRALAQAPCRSVNRGAEIAQVLLAGGWVKEAETMVKKSLYRLYKLSPHHARFAEVSFLVSLGQNQRALEQSVALKESLEDKESVLYGVNLLRIAFLQQAIGNSAGELSGWQDWQEFSSVSERKLLVVKILQGFGSRASVFHSYLEERAKF